MSLVSLGLGTDIFPAGVNGALHRTAPVDASILLALGTGSLNPDWKANRPKIETFGVTFPEGVLLLPPKPPRRQTATTPDARSAGGAADRKRGIRISVLRSPSGGPNCDRRPTRCRCKTGCSTCCSRRWNPGWPDRSW